MNELLDAYSGNNADRYEDIRGKTQRWRREHEVMAEFLGTISPESVLDCPFGTGRWTSLYSKYQCQVLGVDISTSMLENSKPHIAALPEEARRRFTLIEGSIFHLPDQVQGEAFDCAVCTRFVNWITPSQVEKAFASLDSAARHHIILGASVIPNGAGFISILASRLALFATNMRNIKLPRQHVHSERFISGIFDRHGWKIVERVFIFKNASRHNYFYLLERNMK